MVRRAPPRSPPQPSPIDVKIWRACAGGSVRTPELNSRVYYFPQGHVEQASSPPRNLSPHIFLRPFLLCRVTAVSFLADPDTDEVFAKLILHPITITHPLLQSSSAGADTVNGEAPPAAAGDDGDKIVSFAKTLTPSDANNGGGFSVPRQCAEAIFPPLNFEDDPPVQKLSVTDVHGVTWEFRHIYRGTPRRHLLTTGWSKFVNSKSLISDDSVVFMKDSGGRMFVGIRRSGNSNLSLKDGGGDKMPEWLAEIVGLGNNVDAEEANKKRNEEEEEEVAAEEFGSNRRGRVPAKAVAEAMELAAQNKPFEVVYYPRIGRSEFVVRAEVVDEYMSICWRPGMRVKISKESEDSTRVTWHQGAVSAVCTNSDPQWRSSPWRMVQVAWDEPESLRNVNLVSPWEIIPLSITPPVPIPLAPPIIHEVVPPPPKKFRADEADLYYRVTGFSDHPPTMAQVNRSLLSYGITYPAGMQGARHDLLSAPTYPNFSNNNNSFPHHPYMGNNTAQPRPLTLRTEINIWGPPSEDLSPDSQRSILSSVSDSCGTPPNCNTLVVNKAVGSGSIRLFGAIIQGENRGDEGGRVDGTAHGPTGGDDNGTHAKKPQHQ